MKIKFAVFTLSLLMILTMTPSAFAQQEESITFQASSGATQGRLNGHTEMAGGITLARTSGELSAEDADSDPDGMVVINYGVPITNAFNTTVDDAGTIGNNIVVRICGEDGSATNTNVDGSTLTLTLPDDGNCGAMGDTSSISVNGVRLSLAGEGFSSVAATVTTTGKFRLLGGAQTLTIIHSIVDELTDDGIDVADKVTLVRHTGKIDPDDEDAPSDFKLLIMENTVRSFDNAQINLDFSGIPDDVEIKIDAWVAKASDLEKKDFVVDQALNQAGDAVDDDIDLMNAQLSINKAGTLAAIITSEDNEASVLTEQIMIATDDADPDINEEHTGGMFTGERDVVIVLGSIKGATNKDLLPLNLDIQVTVDVGPIGVANPKGDQTESIPRFASDKTTAVTVIDSTSSQISMKVAYVLSEGAYDTGIAVSNMTEDQAGAVRFAFFMNGEKREYSPPDMLGPQSTMRILLSQLLTAAEHTGSFSGYMTITADFTEGDAGVFISDFAGFTSAVTVTRTGEDN